MLKLRKQNFPKTGHEKLRLYLAYTVAALADTKTPQFQEHNFVPTNNHIQELQESQILPFRDPKVCVSSLFGSRSVFQIRQIHSQLVVHGMLQNLIVANKLLYVYAHHKAMDDAYAMFHRMRGRNAVTWSVMVGGFAKVGDYATSFGIFRELIRCGVTPDNYTLPFVIRACRDMTDLVTGKLIHGVVLKHGLHSDHFVCAALVDMYAKCKLIEDARQLFDNMSSRDLVSWTVMIGAYAECRNAYESLVLFDRMTEEGVVADKVAVVSVVYACAKLGAMHKARLVHDYICRNKFSLDVILGTAMIDMYAKCGSICSARDIFDRMKEKNVISWSAMIGAYGYHGHGSEAL